MRRSPSNKQAPQPLGFALLALLIGCLSTETSAFIKVASPQEFENLFKYGTDPNEKEDKLDLFDLLLQDIVPSWLGQKPFNQNGTKVEFKKFNLLDESNDDAVDLTTQELIVRSGFKYEVYDAVSEDGYITQVTRLINPLADPALLRQPPVLIEHGGIIDPSVYLVSSSIQHFPEKWPRTEEDGPIDSWNRSLAFYLANNGFDVWLAETRGSSDTNRRHKSQKLVESRLVGKSDQRNQTIGEQLTDLLKQWDYWAFSQDDIVAHEYRSHIDTVREKSGSDKLHMITYSLSTSTSLAFFSLRPEYAEKIVGYVSMAPIVSGRGVEGPSKILFGMLCPMLPEEMGNLVFNHILSTQPFREFIRLVASHKYVRYSLVKALVGLLVGPSPKWQTLLELNTIGHAFRKLSFREFKQMCQQITSNRLQKFDFGPIKNQVIYGSWQPPVYNLSSLNLKNWIIVAAENDAFAPPASVKQLIEDANPKPSAYLSIPGFNHIDLIAGWENDKYVNEPILRFFESLERRPGRLVSSARGFDLGAMLMGGLLPKSEPDESKAMNETTDGHALTVPNIYMDAITKGVSEFIQVFTKDFEKLFFYDITHPGSIGVPSEGAKKATDALAKGATSAVAAGSVAAVAGAAAAAATSDGAKKQEDNPLASIPIIGDLAGGLQGLGALGTLLGVDKPAGPTGILPNISQVAEATKAIGEVTHVIQDIDKMVHGGDEKKEDTEKKPENSLTGILG